jgi:hypothetical protein
MSCRTGSWKTVLVKAGWLQWLLLLVPAAASAEELVSEQLAADAEFLEYLGSWQDNDADWIAVSAWDENEEQEASVEPVREEHEQGG